MIIVTSSFSKNSVLKMFSFHTKTKSQCFQIRKKKHRFRDGLVWMVDLIVEMEVQTFSNFSGDVRTGPEF